MMRDKQRHGCQQGKQKRYKSTIGIKEHQGREEDAGRAPYSCTTFPFKLRVTINSELAPEFLLKLECRRREYFLYERESKIITVRSGNDVLVDATELMLLLEHNPSGQNGPAKWKLIDKTTFSTTAHLRILHSKPIISPIFNFEQ